MSFTAEFYVLENSNSELMEAVFTVSLAVKHGHSTNTTSEIIFIFKYNRIYAQMEFYTHTHTHTHTHREPGMVIGTRLFQLLRRLDSAWLGRERRGCSEPRPYHYIPAWATEQDSVSKQKQQ